MSLLPSTGRFVWNGALDNTWIAGFVDGRSNWTREPTGSDFIFGTPGAASDVILGAGSRSTPGANFTIGSLAGAGALVLDDVVLTTGANGASTTYGGIMSGSGGLVKTGPGTFTLSGANTYAGGTVVSDGTLQGDATSLQGFIVNDATVAFNQEGRGTYAASMVGTGAVVKAGSGLLRLTGTSEYAGATTVGDGKLIVSGSIGGSGVRVLDGASVGGTGWVPTVTIGRGGALAAGEAGALRVDGDVLFEAGSLYQVQTEA